MDQKANQGFSLVEVIIAIAIFIIAAIPLFNSFALAAKSNAKAREIMNATNLAQNTIEEIKAEGTYAYTGLTSIGLDSYANIPIADTLKMGGKEYYGKVSIAPSNKVVNDEMVYTFGGINPAVDAVYQCSDEMKKQIVFTYREAYGINYDEYYNAFNDKFYLSDLIIAVAESEGIYTVKGSATYTSKENGSWSYDVSKDMYSSANSSNLNIDTEGEGSVELGLESIYVFYSNQGNCSFSYENNTTADIQIGFFVVNQSDGLLGGRIKLEVDRESGTGFVGEMDKPVIYHNLSNTMVIEPIGCNEDNFEGLAKVEKRLYDVTVDIYRDDEYKELLISISGSALK